MEEKGGVSGSFIVISEENSDSLFPMFIGVSCAFFALRLQPESEIRREKWSEIGNKLLHGSALLGLLVWTVYRNAAAAEKSKLLENLKKAQTEIAELKKRRSEDAKANEKVVRIFADERRKLSHQIAALTTELRVAEARRERSVSELGEKLKEIEVILQLKDKMIEEAERRRLESEEKLKELRENLKSENEKHSSEISKHKVAFVELVSNQRQLEAEKEELVMVNQRLSVEIVRLHKDFERKSRLDTVKKEMLFKEMKSSKAKRKQAEAEAERWKAVSESKYEINSLTKLFLKHKRGGNTNATSLDAWNHGIEEFTADAEKAERKHDVEIYAFMEQVRQRDEKVEAYKWRLMSAEMESRQLQSHIDALDRDIARFRQDNAKLEGAVLEREAKLHSLHKQLMAPPNPPILRDAVLGDDTVWSRVKVVKRKPDDKEQDLILTLEQPCKVIKEGKDYASDDHDHIRHERIEAEEVAGQSSSKLWKMDVHALGVSFKLKRLKQQLLVLERLAQNGENDGRVKGFHSLMTLLNRQVDFYNSLQGKVDQLCMRMQENKKCDGRAGDGTKRMEHFLEETFQLQRYIVATGQKLVEVQSIIACNLVAEAEVADIEIERFGDSLKALFRETQRGIEVRISRIIGDLEGTLARHGFNTWRRL